MEYMTIKEASVNGEFQFAVYRCFVVLKELMELNGLEGYGLYLFLQKSPMTPEFILGNM